MTDKEIYRHYLKQLTTLYSPNEAAVITDWVFEKLTGLHRADIIKKNPGTIAPGITDKLNDTLNTLLQSKPVQYALGEAWFYKMKLIVNEHVLIPRPETEELVECLILDLPEIMEYTPMQSQPISKAKATAIGQTTPLVVLDIGTGSGCIAIAIKKHYPGIKMVGIDLSGEALMVAKENALQQGTDIIFLQANFLDENIWDTLPIFDIIISNPPYIPGREIDKMEKNVTRFEPHNALFVPDEQPFIFYEKIALFGKTHLSSSGKIYVEIHEDFVKETAHVFSGYKEVQIKKDIFGKNRMLIITGTGAE